MISVIIRIGERIHRAEFSQLPPEVMKLICNHRSATRYSGIPAKSRLTPRQIQTLDLVAIGYPDKKIAAVMGVSMSTVRFHLNASMRTLNAQNRTEAVVNARIGDGLLAGAQYIREETA